MRNTTAQEKLWTAYRAQDADKLTSCRELVALTNWMVTEEPLIQETSSLQDLTRSRNRQTKLNVQPRDKYWVGCAEFSALQHRYGSTDADFHITRGPIGDTVDHVQSSRDTAPGSLRTNYHFYQASVGAGLK